MVHALHYLQGPTLVVMTVSLIQWRAVITIFNCRFVGLSKNCNLSRTFTTAFEMVFYAIIILKVPIFYIGLVF